MGPPPVLFGSESLFKGRDELVQQAVKSQHPFPAHAVWQRTLRSYTSCGLTKSKDKLIALSGIASELGGNFANDYVAGLWRAYMPTELLWYVDKGTASRRYEAYHAPSFSWASIEGAVVPGEWQPDNILTEVIDSDVMTELSNPFGSVKSGSVTLRGTVKQAWLSKNLLNTPENFVPRNPRSRLPVGTGRRDRGTTYTTFFAADEDWILLLDNVFVPTTVEPAWSTTGRTVYFEEAGAPVPDFTGESWPLLGAKVYLDQPPSADGPALRQVYCLVMTGQSASYTAVRGLVLESVSGAEGMYRRVGLFVIDHWISVNVLGASHRSEPDIPCKDYDAEAHKHTIVVI
jgi:hypothetical protein